MVKVFGTCRGSNLRTHWWTPVVKRAVKLKEGAFGDWLAKGSPEALGRYKDSRKAVVTKAKTQVRKEFR